MFHNPEAVEEFEKEVGYVLGRGLAQTREEAETLALQELALERRMRMQGSRDLLPDTARYLHIEVDEVPFSFLCAMEELFQERIDLLAMGMEFEDLQMEARMEAEYRARNRDVPADGS